MNLENLGVQEMSAEEVKNVDGGFMAMLALQATGLGLCIIAGAAIYASCEAGYRQSYQ